MESSSRSRMPTRRRIPSERDVPFPRMRSSTSASPAGAVVLEDFESGGFGSAWTRTVFDPATVSAAGAHDGAFGVGPGGNGGWYVRTDAEAAFVQGSLLSAWVKPGTGRFYLGFGATSTGGWSFILAPNTGQLLFGYHRTWGSNATNGIPQAFATQWYRAEVEYAGEYVFGRLYDSDGTTLLNEAAIIAEDWGYFGGGGVAVRGFNIAYDTITMTNVGAGVPEPAAWALMILGFGAVGVAARRRTGAPARV
jgi:hypothetical protein